MFNPGQRVGVAVSGGADSVCLLHVLREQASRWNLQLSVIHVNHHIRGEAANRDARFVHELADAFAVPIHHRDVDVPARGGNLEQEARLARYAYFHELLKSGELKRVATGHTRSDQAETVLYRFLRGSGLAGLSGIRPSTREGIVRPLLYVTRNEVLNWLGERGIAWQEDSTNDDRAYVRNRIRHELLPRLQAEYNPGLPDILANLAEVARDEEDWWESYISQTDWQRNLNVNDLRDRAVARRRLRREMAAQKGDLRGISFEHIEAVLEMARSRGGHGQVYVPGLEITRSFDQIRIKPTTQRTFEKPEFRLSVQPPASVELPNNAGLIELKLKTPPGAEENPQTYDILEDELDWQRIAPPGRLELRNWRPGDQYCTVGHSRKRKLKTLFQEARIPLWERHVWPILTYEGEIVWSRRFGPAAEFRAGEGSQTVLRIIDSVANRS
ncbi:MAG TPA: tRNA lysidine(34) synthetase TilS [Bryobacteraceae bacterium]|nr:tRNA lysidine(34) synthetase TilS [Bryobacteraceae bacterium]